MVTHHPDVIIGDAQGAVIASCIRFPMVMEAVLQARNIQRDEAHRMGAAWSKIKGVFVRNPRIGKSKVGLELLLASCPEILKDHPVERLPRYGVVPKICPGKDEVLDYCSKMNLPVQDSLAGFPWKTILEQPVREYWEHDGKCQCGKRTYLFGQCPECLRQEALERNLETDLAMEQKALAPREPAEDELAVDLVAAVAEACAKPVIIFPSELICVWAQTRNGTPSWPGLRGELHYQTWSEGKGVELKTSAHFPFRSVLAIVPDSLSRRATDKVLVLPVQQCLNWTAETTHVLEADSWLKSPGSIHWNRHHEALNRFCEGQRSRTCETLLHLCFASVDRVDRWTVPSQRLPDRVLQSSRKIVFYCPEDGHWRAVSVR